MDYTVNQYQDRIVIAMNGRLTFADARTFDSVLGHLHDSTHAAIEFDLSGLEFVDSTGMSLFVHAYDAAKDRARGLRLRHASQTVRSALTRAGFDRLVTLD